MPWTCEVIIDADKDKVGTVVSTFDYVNQSGVYRWLVRIPAAQFSTPDVLLGGSIAAAL